MLAGVGGSGTGTDGRKPDRPTSIDEQGVHTTFLGNGGLTCIRW